jgi:hypothetical protein
MLFSQTNLSMTAYSYPNFLRSPREYFSEPGVNPGLCKEICNGDVSIKQITRGGAHKHKPSPQDLPYSKIQNDKKQGE